MPLYRNFVDFVSNQVIGGIKTFTNAILFGGSTVKASLTSDDNGTTNTISIGRSVGGSTIISLPAISGISGTNDNETRFNFNGTTYFRILSPRGGTSGIVNVTCLDAVSESSGIIPRPIRFRAINTANATIVNALQINDNGNLLIGTTTDNGDKLQIAGNGNFTGNIRLPVSDSNGIILGNGTTTGFRFGCDNVRQSTIHLIDTDPTAQFRVLTSNLTVPFRILNSSRVLIGSGRVDDGINTLQINGSFDTSTAANSTVFSVSQNSGGRTLSFGATGLIDNTTATFGATAWGGIANTETYSGNSARVGLLVQGFASQSANLQQWRNSANAVLASVDANGIITAPQFRQSANSTAPASSSDTGTLGEIRIDANFIYYCVANNSWKRAPLSTW